MATSFFGHVRSVRTCIIGTGVARPSVRFGLSMTETQTHPNRTPLRCIKSTIVQAHHYTSFLTPVSTARLYPPVYPLGGVSPMHQSPTFPQGLRISERRDSPTSAEEVLVSAQLELLSSDADVEAGTEVGGEDVGASEAEAETVVPSFWLVVSCAQTYVVVVVVLVQVDDGVSRACNARPTRPSVVSAVTVSMAVTVCVTPRFLRLPSPSSAGGGIWSPIRPPLVFFSPRLAGGVVMARLYPPE